MTCDRIQRDLSRVMDDELSPQDAAAALDHASTCAECGEFRRGAVEVMGRYRSQVLSGVDRLRKGAAAQVWTSKNSRRRRMVALVSLAAVAMVCWVGGTRSTPPTSSLQSVAVAGMPLTVSPKAAFHRFFDTLGEDEDDEESPSLAYGRGLPLPVRLDQDFESSSGVPAVIDLPRSLRF